MIKRRTWVTVAVVANVAAAMHGAQAAEGSGSALENDYPGTFASSLEHLLAGEGGEGGLGMSPLRRVVTIPALNGAQIEKVLGGNTVRREDYAIAFDANGKFSGWEKPWEKVGADKCAAAAKSDKTYEVEHGECWHQLHVDIPAGTWKVEGDRLCTQPALRRVVAAVSCVSAALVLDRLALFDDSGKMLGKPSDLVAGKQLAPLEK
jgi:hypothetical protein